MKDATITNPRGANHGAAITDYRLFKDANGFPFGLWDQSYIELDSNGVIPLGAACIFVAPTATQPMRVAAAGTNPSGQTIKGIALNAATAAGQNVKLCYNGFCFAKVQAAPTAAAAFGTFGLASADAGGVNSSVTALAATDVVGSVLGTFLGAVDATTGLAPFWYEHV